MAKIRTLRTSFNAGELHPVMDGRPDIDAYQNGAAQLRNFRIMPTGGIKRRAATRFKTLIANGTYQLEDFTFDVTQAYIIAFSATKVDFYDDAGNLVHALTGCPWAAAAIGALSVAQRGDTMVVAHESFAPQLLVRTTATDFERRAFVFEDTVAGAEGAPAQPYFKYNAPESTLRIAFLSYAGGSTTFEWNNGYVEGTKVRMTCSEVFFTASMVGTVIQWENGFIRMDTLVSGLIADGTVLSKQLYKSLQSNPLRSRDGSSWVTVSDPFHGHAMGTNVFITNALGVSNIASNQINGQRAVVNYNAMEFSFNTGTVAAESYYGGGDGIRLWSNTILSHAFAEPCFSAHRGWPRCCTFDDQRLVFGGCTSLPNRLFASQVDAPFNFWVGTGRDNESIQASIASQRVAIINAVVSYKHLQIFTSEGEYYCPGSEGKPLTPDTVSFKRQSSYGIGRTQPVEFDGSTLFVTRTNAVREFLFNADDNGYKSPSLTMMASHITSSVTRLESQIEDVDEQETIAFTVRSDGRLGVMTFSRAEKVLAWGLWETQGQFRDIVSVNRRLWAVVERNLGGGLRTFLEEFDQLQVIDCVIGLTSGTAQTVWTNALLANFNGTTVNLLGPGAEDLGTAACSGNTVTAPKAVTSLSVGYGFAPVLQTLPPEVAMQDGPSQGQMRRLVRVGLNLYGSYTAAVNGTAMQLRRIETVNTPAPAVSSMVEYWPRGWDDKGQVLITCPEQAPLTIKSLVAELEF